VLQLTEDHDRCLVLIQRCDIFSCCVAVNDRTVSINLFVTLLDTADGQSESRPVVHWILSTICQLLLSIPLYICVMHLMNLVK